MVKCPSIFYLFAKLLRYTRMFPKISNVSDNLLQNSTFRIFVEKYIEYLFLREEITKHFWNHTQTPDRQLSHKGTDRTSETSMYQCFLRLRVSIGGLDTY